MKIRFEALELENFAIYPHVEVEFSLDDAMPLTLIRGENNSGKTTLMRAFIWILFGESHVPALADSTHPIRPAWAEQKAIQTKGVLKFRVEQPNGDVVLYKLIRKGRTRVESRPGKPDKVIYDNDELDLFRNVPGAGFQKANDRLAALQLRYFPDDIREFILIDADKAEDLVGGSAANHNLQLMRKTTTTAVRSLLGLEPMRRSGERIRRIGSDLMAKAARNSGDKDLTRLADEEEKVAMAVKEQNAIVTQLEGEVERLGSEVRDTRLNRDSQFREHDEIQSVARDLEIKKVNRKNLIDLRTRQIASLSTSLLSERGLGLLLAPALADVVTTLDPLKIEGRIPASEISLLPRLLRDDECVCGLKFSEHPDRRAEVERRIELSSPRKAEANFGDQCLETARDILNRSLGPGATGWIEEITEFRTNLGDTDRKLLSIDAEIERLEKEISEKSKSEIGVLSELAKAFDTLTETYRDRERKLETARSLLKQAQSDQRSVSEGLRLARTKSKDLAHNQNLAKFAENLAIVIDGAREIIESEEVSKIDETVNTIFMEVVGATEGSLYKHVGIRSTPEDHEIFEPYVEGSSGEDRPLSILNGASRRAVSTAVVLALSEVTGTSIPFVADSLLHATSGAVKRRLVDYLTSGKQVGQPILFATRDDLLADRENDEVVTVKEIVKARAGKTYTVTSQADGDIVNRDLNAEHPQQSVLCLCGPDEFCNVCERKGDVKAKHLISVKESNR